MPDPQETPANPEKSRRSRPPVFLIYDGEADESPGPALSLAPVDLPEGPEAEGAKTPFA
ncbi:MAG TPA: hypothetical protein VHI52_04300 [Verrucomicrobiae bacterium]|nr:hypothetical protein [Verrucomicrobiae bacterium]HWC62864.1 hypothetical protein [Rhizomicrobium sp.]